MSNVDDYLKNGGKITQCPTINGNADRKKVNKTRKKGEVEYKINSKICEGCINNRGTRKKRKACQGMCNPLIWINGTEETKEQFFDDLKSKPPESANYNETLSELINNQIYRGENEPEIKDARKKAIYAMIKEGLDNHQIARLMKITVKHLRRISKEITPQKSTP
jgi:hypothetical protein